VRLLAGHWLWLLLVVAALAAAYAWVQVRGRRQAAVRFTNLELLASVAPRRPGWRRHVAAALLLATLATLPVALARPTRTERVPTDRTVVVLALDVSISMQAEDVEPTRLAAAQDAAVRFARDLPEGVELGLVAFAGTAAVLVPPTDDHEATVRAVERLELAESTAIGDAILVSLDAVAGAARDDGEPPPAAIVLMSDGEATIGTTPPEVAAEAAAEAEVPVSTIAFGTDAGRIEYLGQIVPVPVNRPQLAGIADATGGSAFTAATGGELRQVYDDIGSAVGYDEERREVTTWFVGVAFVLGAAAAAAALRWTSRLP
jgi:Ca-activated chloride channel family protein